MIPINPGERTSPMDSSTIGLLDRSRTAIDTEFARIVDELTRRGFLTGAAGAAALVGLSACGDQSSSGRGHKDMWTFADDTGHQVSLPSAPKRVAALNDPLGESLWSAGIHVIATRSRDSAFEKVGATPAELDAVVYFAKANGLPDLELLATARPDLIVDNTSDGHSLDAVSKAPQISTIAPVVGINQNSQSFDEAMASIGRLATALGVATADSTARRDYQDQVRKLSAALDAKPGLRVAFLFGGTDGLRLEVADQWPGLRTLTDLGMNIEPASASGAFSDLSWENAPDLRADALVWVAELPVPTQPLWQRMPAIKAGQFLNLQAQMNLLTYANYTQVLGHITTLVQRSQPGVAPH